MPSTITNEATATYQFDGSPETSVITSNQNVVTLLTASGLVISKTGTPTSFVAGDIITYTVDITNNTGSFLNGVRIIDDLGGGRLAYVVGSGSLTVGILTYPVSPVATNPLTFTLQQLNVGQSMRLTYKSQVVFNLPPSVDSITNTVRAIGYTSTGTIEGVDSFIIQKKTDGDVSITKTASVLEVYPNESFDYFLSIRNNSETGIRVLSVTDRLPSNFVISQITLETIGGTTILSPEDYTLSSGNILTVPSAIGPLILVPAGGLAEITITGYLV